jgi:hypothetical protein
MAHNCFSRLVIDGYLSEASWATTVNLCSGFSFVNGAFLSAAMPGQSAATAKEAWPAPPARRLTAPSIERQLAMGMRCRFDSQTRLFLFFMVAATVAQLELTNTTDGASHFYPATRLFSIGHGRRLV